MVRVSVLALVALMLFASNTAAQPTGGDAKSVAVDVVRWNFLGQYGRVWQVLHPRYQHVTTRTFWESCKRKNAPTGIQVKSLKAVDSYLDTITLPLLGKLHVTAVTLQMRFTTPTLSGTQSVSDTVYMTKVGSAWKGLWEVADYQAYSHHRCPPS
jgi:hypothetical protein